MNDIKKIGLGLTGFGVFFSFLGLVFFFNKQLIAMGNIFFLSGLGLTIGLKSTMKFFTKPNNYKGTISFGAGFFLILIGWPFFGMLLEAYGFVILFSGFWPTLAVFLQRIPILGWIFQQPFVTSFLDRYRGKRMRVGFWPTLAVFLQRIPILGWIFQQPFVTSFLERYRRMPV